ncbi:flagellar basal body-associated protein FliL [Burkholderia pseudomallei]|nr:flagellar basal body-associated protein FliL [Burkholderia pseudomallei]ONE26300.1 flagellar basal body-associated protein FliL [Burkholderia pseudomallei]ONE50532.1 flagellar basal body-associated protein FliL [Burkholderia pseudomallei]
MREIVTSPNAVTLDRARRAARGARRARFAPQLHSPVSNLNRTGT